MHHGDAEEKIRRRKGGGQSGGGSGPGGPGQDLTRPKRLALGQQEITRVAILDGDHVAELAELAVADTGLGNVADKITKNTRKTFGALRDLMRARTVGIIEEDAAKGLVKYAKPVGVVAAVCPSTNPAATPVNKAGWGARVPMR